MANSTKDPLAQLRVLFFSFAGSLVLIGIVVILLASGLDPADESTVGATIAAVAAIGIAIAIGLTFVLRDLPCGTDQELVDAYRVRMFLRSAIAQSGALFGFIGFFVAGDATVYFVALAIALFNLLRFAPSASNLEKDDARLAAAGCGSNLTGAFRRVAATDAAQ